MSISPAPRISLDQWRALLAVVDEGGYAQAAKALNKSQSSVTYAVQQLESQLGVKAFRIEGRKAHLTPTGQLLYRRARYLLVEAAGLEHAAKKLSAGWEAEIHLAVETIFPTWLLLECLERLGTESPHTRVELIETVLGGRDDALLEQAELAIFGTVPQGFLGEPLMRMRFILAAHPDHPLHRLGRKLTIQDLRAHRQLVVRESSPQRSTPLTLEATQRWTVSNLATSIQAARSGHGFAWLPEDRIREEIEAGTLKALPLREGGERFADLYLIFADREHAGPATLRLAEIIREAVASECRKSAVVAKPAVRRRPKRSATGRSAATPG
jgi:DNA-binding transcriptional LysR family regulator